MTPTRRRTLRPLVVVFALALLLSGCVSLPSAPSAGSPSPGTDPQATSTPPMGWNSWNHFGCDVTEIEVKAAADAMASDGLQEAGYRYIDLDDCWQASSRAADGTLRADPTRFPDGIAALAAYVHARGFAFGLYASPGSRTCAEHYDGYPGRMGSLGHVEQDARTFASWGVDYLKYDWCAAADDGVGHEQAFAQMRAALNATGRHVVLGIHDKPEQPVPAWRHWVADLSRTSPDIRPTWSSVIGNARSALAGPSYGPGFTNDPDMLEIGNAGLTEAEQRSQFALWAELSAPLLIGCDVPNATAGTLGILSNDRIIAVDQDARAAAPSPVASPSGSLVLRKQLADGDTSVTVTNLGSKPATLRLSTAALQPATSAPHDRAAPYVGSGSPAPTIQLTNLFTGASHEAGGIVIVQLGAHATAMLRFSALPASG